MLPCDGRVFSVKLFTAIAVSHRFLPAGRGICCSVEAP